jgi:sirohydrochlorin cobaltochelatase
MEQDHLLGRNQPLTGAAGGKTALLIAAHGERQPGAGNESTFRIARAVAAKGLVAEVVVGFINGAPTVAEALASLAARKVIVYPLFASNGYFTRDRLVQILDEANGQNRAIHILPPLGLDPSLPKLLADRAAHVTREYGFSPEAVAVILLAHGSRRNPASREATGWLASEIARREVFRDVKIALLEERPHLQDAAQSIEGPAIVMGIFSGSGLHGARDAPRLVAKLARPEVIFAGAIGDAPGVDEVVGSSVLKALAERS